MRVNTAAGTATVNAASIGRVMTWLSQVHCEGELITENHTKENHANCFVNPKLLTTMGRYFCQY